jgi:dUTPase
VGGEGESITIIKADQIVIAVALMHALLIKRVDNNVKLPIRGSHLVTRIDIMANQDIISPPGEQSTINRDIAFTEPPGTHAQIAP